MIQPLDYKAHNKDLQPPSDTLSFLLYQSIDNNSPNEHLYPFKPFKLP